MGTFTQLHAPADIVKLFPKASDIFKRYRIDFCCGGEKPLSQIFEIKTKLNGDEILGELNTAYTSWKENGNVEMDWDSITQSDLIDHILEKHHRFLDEELTALGQFVTKIYRVHGQHHPHLIDLYKVYNQFKSDMEVHLVEEEKELFPLIRQYEITNDEALLSKIIDLNKDMVSEHLATGELLQQINDLTDGFVPPADACNSYRITYARLAELESNTFQHIHLENNILFKKYAS
ncbi:iron-sulfur cluster repair di-iron protein [Aquibacillus kalidii]|uniref:iron-sulfur cluster repair di-iron protein n=1 Tax=Aquibacillus kalidii TaxID=2762597 RepID=UPI0016441EBC|nr:iron-sulfur cluster repair di-iron protein [Aquibacillus kalidii]